MLINDTKIIQEAIDSRNLDLLDEFVFPKKRLINNKRKEYTAVLNYFFVGHRNKLSMDVSHLTLDDGLVNVDATENRVRFQWDVSF